MCVCVYIYFWDSLSFFLLFCIAHLKFFLSFLHCMSNVTLKKIKKRKMKKSVRKKIEAICGRFYIFLENMLLDVISGRKRGNNINGIPVLCHWVNDWAISNNIEFCYKIALLFIEFLSGKNLMISSCCS